jgi:acyl carrier protein
MAEARHKPAMPSGESGPLLSFISPRIHQGMSGKEKSTVTMMSSADTIVKMISDRSSHTGGTIHLSESLENVGLDSMEVVSLIFDIEEAFNIQIPLNANMDIEGKTVADLIQSVDKLVAAKVESN